MASNPYFSPYHTQRFSFIGSPQQRDGTYVKDQRFLNLYPELIKSPVTDGKKYYLKKRPGTTPFQTLGAGQGRGVFFWASQGHYFSVVGNQLYQDSTPIQTLTTSTGPVGWAEFKTDSVDVLIMLDGVHGYQIGPGSFGGVTQITDANFPSPHVPQPVYLDGYIFVAAVNTQTVHNSQLGAPLVWPSDGFIDAEMFPDALVGLSKCQNYLACIGTQSIEWLYDNANSTGSPMQRNAPAVSQIGCPAPSTINQTEKELIMVGSTNNGGRTVWIFNGFQPTEIANEPVREALDLEASNISAATAYTIQCSGHKWYVLNLKSNLRTFVYDFEEQMWHEWSSGPGNSYFNFDFAADAGNGTPILLGELGATSNYILAADQFTDNGTAINCVATTVKIDFDTIMRKRFYRLSLVGDAPTSGNTPILVEWSDDDYNTFVGQITLELNGTYPTITQLGYARRRAFRFTYTQPSALRLESFELDVIQEVRR